MDQRRGPPARHGASRPPQPGDATRPPVRERPRDIADAAAGDAAATMLPPAGFAVRYEPAVSPLEIGGDWYDVLPVGDHQIGIIVGDCVGRGLPAAAVMGQLRSSARALLLTGADRPDCSSNSTPRQRSFRMRSAPRCFVGVARHRARGSCATAAQVMCRRCSPRRMPRRPCSPTPARCRWPCTASAPARRRRVTLTPGSTLLLYTDGLVERRDSSIDEGIARVADVLAESMRAADRFRRRRRARESWRRRRVRRRRGDRRLPPTAGSARASRPMQQPIDCTTSAMPIADWLRAAGIDRRTHRRRRFRRRRGVRQQHRACLPRHRTRPAVRGARIRSGKLHVRIVDRGSWKAPCTTPTFRGRGLPLIKAVSAEVVFDGTDLGTTVEMIFRLPAPALQTD